MRKNIADSINMEARRLALRLAVPYVTEDCREPLDENRHQNLVERLMLVCGNTEDTACVERSLDRIRTTCDTVYAEELMHAQGLSEADLKAKYKTSKRGAFFNFKARVNKLVFILRSAGEPSIQSARDLAFAQLSESWGIPVERLEHRYLQSLEAVKMVRLFREDIDALSCTVTFANTDYALVITKDEFKRILVDEVTDDSDSSLTTFYTTNDLPRFAYKLFTNKFKISSTPPVRGVVQLCTYQMQQ